MKRTINIHTKSMRNTSKIVSRSIVKNSLRKYAKTFFIRGYYNMHFHDEILQAWQYNSNVHNKHIFVIKKGHFFFIFFWDVSLRSSNKVERNCFDTIAQSDYQKTRPWKECMTFESKKERGGNVTRDPAKKACKKYMNDHARLRRKRNTRRIWQ